MARGWSVRFVLLRHSVLGLKAKLDLATITALPWLVLVHILSEFCEVINWVSVATIGFAVRCARPVVPLRFCDEFKLRTPSPI